ncbi:MAG: NAD(P)-dependent alcohol dehydrogenase [Clostridia bacterium]
MKAAVLTGIKEMEIRDVPVPVAKDDQVLVKIEYVGICGSDIHYYEHGRIGDFVVSFPMILGHECAGEIVEAGKSAKGFQRGDKVVIEPGYGCRVCDMCKQGKYNLCGDMTFMATPPVDGAFCEYVAYPCDMVYPLPPGLSSLEGALVEPLAIGVYAAEKAGVVPGMDVLVLGAGCIGILTMMSCKAYGARSVGITDLNGFRLEKARELGADETFLAGKKQLRENFFDVVIDCAGVEETLAQGIRAVKKGGKVLLVGLGSEGDIPLDIHRAVSKEISIDTVFRYRNVFKKTISLIAGGKIDVKGIVTHTYPLEDIGKAFAFTANNKGKVLKSVVRI